LESGVRTSDGGGQFTVFESMAKRREGDAIAALQALVEQLRAQIEKQAEELRIMRGLLTPAQLKAVAERLGVRNSTAPRRSIDTEG
jgi:uncharacterized protein YerC